MTDLDRLGGKGANLVRLRNAGFPVPAFVVLPTAEYDAFVAEHGLDAVIQNALTRPDAEASRIIREAFERPLSDAQRARVELSVGPLLERHGATDNLESDVRVAVRSSATAEDLPDASFAGQQDTYLNVTGRDAIADAIVACWSSLWTERAIAYRARTGVPHESVSLAVVIQRMVDAEASGVAFTADPLTGRRDVVVIDAVRGLGEQLVSGQVTPVHYEVDAAGIRVVDAVGVRVDDPEASPTPTAAAHPDTDAADERPAPPLTTAQARALASLCREVEDSFGAPQDLEWTRVGDEIALVQSRPITSLYPLPEPTHPTDLWFSFGAFQGVLQPLTPLGQDVLRALLAGAASVFGHHVDADDNAFIRPAGERLWMRFDRLLATPLGRRVLPVMLRAADPTASAVVSRLLDEGFDPGDAPARPMVAGSAAHAIVPALPRIAGALRRPVDARVHLERDTDATVASLRVRLDAASSIERADLRLAARVRAIDDIGRRAFGVLLPDFAPIMGPSIAMVQRLRALAAKTELPDADALAVAVLRSLPGNVTTAMDLALWDASRDIASDPTSRDLFETATVDELTSTFTAGTLPGPAQDAVTDFLDRFGMRGMAEIDLGTPRWREQPATILATLVTYVGTPPDQAPDALYRAGIEDADRAVERLAAASTRADAAQIRFLASRIRGMFGARETPKFMLIRLMGLIRPALQASGDDLADAGLLSDRDDVFFLHLDELRRAFAADHREIVRQRRGVYEREMRRTRVPVVIAGDGRAFVNAGTDADDATLKGTGVSPGVVEGRAHVVDHPGDASLRPGEILVCRGTDPSWTPLFLTASGLITEVGGLMTHGSVVAREYGLPAVVGIPGATSVLADGPMIRVDGSSGAVTVLPD